MSAFHLRDTLSESGFSNRVDSVFAALGSGSVKSPDNAGGSSSNSGSSRRRDQPTPNFDQDQYNRSIRPKESNAKRRKFDENFDFKHPAEFLRPEGRDRPTSGGSGMGNNQGRGTGGHRGGGGGNNRDRVVARGRGNGGGRGRGGYTPDYKKNPDKWTKYSLADVDNMTDRSNSAAAFQFLKALK